MYVSILKRKKNVFVLFYFLEKMCRECFRRLAACKCDRCDVIMCQGCFDKVIYL